MFEQIRNAIDISQRCQRNWDLTKGIDDDILKLLEYVVVNSPSKQNEEYYDVYFITNRDVIEQIYQNTDVHEDLLVGKNDYTKNSQALANLLVVFGSKDPQTKRNRQDDYTDVENEKNRNQAIGIAAGQLVMTASMIGLKTGFNGCFDSVKVAELLNCKSPRLVIGIGYPDLNKDRRLHQLTDKIFPTFDKPITVTRIGEETTMDIFSGEVNRLEHRVRLEYTPPEGANVSEEDFFEYKAGIVPENVVFLAVMTAYKLAGENKIDPNAYTGIEDGLYFYEWSSDDQAALDKFYKGVKASPGIVALLDAMQKAGWTPNWTTSY